jgi:hypothetical protein
MRTGVLVSAALLAAAGLAGVAWWNSSHIEQPESQPVTMGAESQGASAGSPAASMPNPETPLPAREVLVLPQEPGIFTGFHRWSDDQRLQAINALATQPELDSDVVAFLKHSLGDANLAAHVRNEIANRLLSLAQPDPAVAEILVAAVNDANQPGMWRDYALQHAARAINLHRDPSVVLALLREKASGADAMAGTALVNLETVEAAHPEVSVDIARLAAGLAGNAQAALPTRITALAMIGSRGMREQADVVRAIAASGGEPALVRVALATLGLIGEANDLPLVERHLTDANRGIVLAAEGAATRLRAKKANL